MSTQGATARTYRARSPPRWVDRGGPQARCSPRPRKNARFQTFRGQAMKICAEVLSRFWNTQEESNSAGESIVLMKKGLAPEKPSLHAIIHQVQPLFCLVQYLAWMKDMLCTPRPDYDSTGENLCRAAIFPRTGCSFAVCLKVPQPMRHEVIEDRPLAPVRLEM